MKPQTKTLLILLGIPFLLISSECKKHHTNPYSDNGLPPATQTGANTFACRVNGEVWIVKPAFGISVISGGISNDTLGVLGTTLKKNSDFWGDLYIWIGYFDSSKQKYSLDDSINSYIMYNTNKSCFTRTGGYGVGNAKSTDGELTLTRVDTVNKIISGTFWATIPTAYCDTLHITQGRFDIDYR